MTAYKPKDLYNLVVKSQSKEAFDKGYISHSSYQKVLTSHPVNLYSPNIFAQVGMALLTFIVLIAVFALFVLVFSLYSVIAGLTIFIGIASYAMLEYLVVSKKHFNSGVDNLLMAAVPLLIVSGIGMELTNGERILSLIFFAICTWQAIRFTDRLMALAAAASLLAFIFNVFVNFGEWTITYFPFVMIPAAAAIYMLAVKAENKDSQLIYKPCWFVVKSVGLVAFYAVGNFYVVDAIANDTFLLQQDSPIHIAWFFWSWTFVVPIGYLFVGIKQRDLLFIRLGLLFLTASILTYRQYHALLPIEIALVVAGAIILVTTYWLMQYLKQPKHGFVFADYAQPDKSVDDLEALAVGEAYDQNLEPVEDTRFGGGSFGGAGAGSSY